MTSLLESFLSTIRKSASIRLSISSAPWIAGTYPRSLEEVPKPTNPGTVPCSLARSSAVLPLLEGYIWKREKEELLFENPKTNFLGNHCYVRNCNLYFNYLYPIFTIFINSRWHIYQIVNFMVCFLIPYIVKANNTVLSPPSPQKTS